MDLSKYLDMAIVYASEYGLKIITALAICVVGKWFVKKLTRISKKIMLKAKIDVTLVGFAENLIYFMLLVMVVLASLSILGINTNSFIAVFGAAGLAIGLALQGSLANIGAAVLIIIFRPFKVGDIIQAAGVSGTVKEINLFSTIILPFDKGTIIIPNSSIIRDNIVNLSDRESRRVEHIFGISYDDDLKLAKEILTNIVANDSRVLLDPPSLVAVSGLGDNSVNLIVRAWTSNDDFWDVHYDMLENVKLAFDENGISIPYPQMDIHINKQES